MSRRRGGTTVELALLMPILVLYLGVFIESIWIFWTHTTMMTVVDHACRQGAAALDETVVESAVKTASTQSSLSCPSTDCTVSATMDDISDVSVLQCDLSFAYSGLTGVLPLKVTLEARSVIPVTP